VLTWLFHPLIKKAALVRVNLKAYVGDPDVSL